MKSPLRIVSFLPAATEMICALGLEENVVGVSHECDFPVGVKAKPVVVRAAFDFAELSQAQIDEAVAAQLRSGRSLYRIDENLLADLAPDVIVTQDLCQVCAPSGNEVTRAIKALAKSPRVVSLTPKTLGDVFLNVGEIAEIVGCSAVAETLQKEWRARIERVVTLVAAQARKPRVFCMEWIDPIYCSGHWLPEMVEIAGGQDVLGRKGGDSVRLSWEQVREAEIELMVILPCGYGLEAAVEKASQLKVLPGWNDLPAVRQHRVYAVDANAYFARPGPRLVDGLELLAHLFHPHIFGWPGDASQAYRRIG